MNKAKSVLFSKLIVFALMITTIASVVLLAACDENFNTSTTIKTNAANTTDANMQYTSLTVKANQIIYINWTIPQEAKDNASAYKLVVLDNDKHALTQQNNIVSLSVYDSSQKALGTATTQTIGQYDLSAVLGDNKIAAGKYYAKLEFATDGTYNVCIVFTE